MQFKRLMYICKNRIHQGSIVLFHSIYVLIIAFYLTSTFNSELKFGLFSSMQMHTYIYINLIRMYTSVNNYFYISMQEKNRFNCLRTLKANGDLQVFLKINIKTIYCLYNCILFRKQLIVTYLFVIHNDTISYE